MEKIKQFIGSETGKNVLMVFIIILVSLSSFELGKLYAESNSTSGVKINYPLENEVQTANLINSVGTPQNDFSKDITPTESAQKSKNSNLSENFFFASKRGKKYYPMNCSAGKNIKLENRIYFSTREEATNAGYTLSSSCR